MDIKSSDFFISNHIPNWFLPQWWQKQWLRHSFKEWYTVSNILLYSVILYRFLCWIILTVHGLFGLESVNRFEGKSRLALPSEVSMMSVIRYNFLENIFCYFHQSIKLKYDIIYYWPFYSLLYSLIDKFLFTYLIIQYFWQKKAKSIF